MANDRLYIKCRGCGEMIMLAKHFAGAWSVRRSQDEIGEFLEAHAFCNGHFNEFFFATEMGENGYPDAYKNEVVRAVPVVKNADMIREGELADYLKKHCCFNTYIVGLKYKYDWEKEYDESNEIIYYDGSNDCYVWLNDWNEGQTDCWVTGIIDIDRVDLSEGYNLKE